MAWAIGQSQPGMSLSLRRSYAETIVREGRKHHIDAFTIVAIGHNETRWTNVVGGKNGQCVGICQHCLFKYARCRANLDDPWCVQKKAWLLDGNNNITETASDITHWRTFCARVTGHAALLYRVLHGFQGYGQPGLLCGMKKTRSGWKDVPKPKQVRQVMNYRQQLIRRAPR